jgi:hypothetical protein
MLYGAGTPANIEVVVLSSNRLLCYEAGNLEDAVLRRWAKACAALSSLGLSKQCLMFGVANSMASGMTCQLGSQYIG